MNEARAENERRAEVHENLDLVFAFLSFCQICRAKLLFLEAERKKCAHFFVILCPILDTKSLWMAVRIKKHRGQPDGLSPFRFDFSERREESPGSAEHFAF